MSDAAGIPAGRRPGTPAERAESEASLRAAAAGGEGSWAPARGLREEVCRQPAWPCRGVACVLVAAGVERFLSVLW